MRRFFDTRNEIIYMQRQNECFELLETCVEGVAMKNVLFVFTVAYVWNFRLGFHKKVYWLGCRTSIASKVCSFDTPTPALCIYTHLTYYPRTRVTKQAQVVHPDCCGVHGNDRPHEEYSLHAGSTSLLRALAPPSRNRCTIRMGGLSPFSQLTLSTNSSGYLVFFPHFFPLSTSVELVSLYRRPSLPFPFGTRTRFHPARSSAPSRISQHFLTEHPSFDYVLARVFHLSRSYKSHVRL